jgi:pimeloyl-ACP methyl ester carboxylesterase
MAGPTKELVLVHGLGSASSYWDNLRPALERDYRVTAVDLPGHGPDAVQPTQDEALPRAMATSVTTQLSDRGIERPHVVGLSLGGWVALEMGALGHAASVTALAPAGLWREGATIPLEREGAFLHHWLALVDPSLPFFTRLPLVKRFGLWTTVVHPDRVSHQQFLAGARALGQAKGYSVCDQAAVDHRFEDAVDIDVPTTVAFGDADRVLPPDSSQERSLVPDHADWVQVPDCGHAMSWDQPDTCVRLIRETVARASGG